MSPHQPGGFSEVVGLTIHGSVLGGGNPNLTRQLPDTAGIFLDPVNADLFRPVSLPL